MLQQLLNQIEAATSKDSKPEPELITVQYLRKLVGIMGMILAFFLLVGNLAFGNCGWDVQPSISHYYYTNMRDFFVGTLFSVAIFLFCYKGHNKWDNRASTLAAIFAFVTAILPTDIETCTTCRQPVVSFLDFSCRGYVHLVAASLFLLTLALMSILLFTKSNHSKNQLTKNKNFRNRIYYTCGLGIILNLVAAGISILLKRWFEFQFPYVFLFEFVALLLFGVSWLTKGGVIYPDKNQA